MWKNPGTCVPIDPSQLVPGLYVWLDMPWTEHPFISSRLMVKTAKDVAILQALDPAGRLYYHPDRSTASPAPVVPAPAAGSAALAARALEQAALQQDLQRLEKAKKDQLRLQKDATTRANRAWERAAQATREALLNLVHSPKAAGKQLAQLSAETASTIAAGQEILLHLMGDRKDYGPQVHALNTMTLSLLVGKKAGLGERELENLALGALAHDAGKSHIPPQILKTSKRKKHEEAFYRQHVLFSTQIAEKSGVFSRAALAVIADHHEAVDGSGWPTGKKDADIGARILSMVDRYDRLCSPEATDREPLMPAEALSSMFRNEAGKFDPALLSTLVKLLGVYPPGTVVHLSDGTLAMVVAPGRQSLRPKVLIYSPELPKDEAPTLELDSAPELRITEAIRPGTLSPEVLQWLNLQQRLSYYFSVEDNEL